jgi:hypothetical protein
MLTRTFTTTTSSPDIFIKIIPGPLGLAVLGNVPKNAARVAQVEYS